MYCHQQDLDCSNLTVFFFSLLTVLWDREMNSQTLGRWWDYISKHWSTWLFVLPFLCPSARLFSQSTLIKCFFPKTLSPVQRPTVLSSHLQKKKKKSDFQTLCGTKAGNNLFMVGGLVFWGDWALPLAYAQLILIPQTLPAGVARRVCG